MIGLARATNAETLPGSATPRRSRQAASHTNLSHAAPGTLPLLRERQLPRVASRGLVLELNIKFSRGSASGIELDSTPAALVHLLKRSSSALASPRKGMLRRKPAQATLCIAFG
jgi:hypothetical protein